MVLEEDVLNFQDIPKEIRTNCPWLSETYIFDQGYIPTSNLVTGGEQTSFGYFIYKPKSKIKIGDLIIFRDYEDEEERFQIVDGELFRMLVFNELGGPVGVVIPRPEN
jgi:hypothetical protein